MEDASPQQTLTSLRADLASEVIKAKDDLLGRFDAVRTELLKETANVRTELLKEDATTKATAQAASESADRTFKHLDVLTKAFGAIGLLLLALITFFRHQEHGGSGQQGGCHREEAQ